MKYCHVKNNKNCLWYIRVVRFGKDVMVSRESLTSDALVHPRIEDHIDYMRPCRGSVVLIVEDSIDAGSGVYDC